MENMYNLNIERAVLSAIIFDPQIFEEIASKLRHNDFYLPFHQHLFSAIEELAVEEKPIDEEFLRAKLISMNTFDEIAMLEILAANPISNTTAYLTEIKSKASKRALVTLATEIRKVTIEDDLPTEEIMNLVEKKLYEITQNSTNEDFRESKDITLTMMDEIERLKALGNSKLIGTDTGFRNLNEKTSGFGKGDLVIIAARPAMGKCLGKGTKVLMYSGELKKVEDIQVGEELMGDDSTPRRVLSLARGREEMYWVHQNKGIDYRVNKSHILSLIDDKKNIINIEVSKYLDKNIEFKKRYKGYKATLNSNKVSFPIPSITSENRYSKITVQYDKVDDYYGFEIDGNRLFLLEDMTVTHNTALVLNMALKAIERDEGVAFFSLEMPAEQLMLRMLSAKTSIPLQALRVGDLRDEQWSQFSSAVDDISRKKLFVDDGGYATIHHVRSKLRKLKSQHPEISVAIIDYLQLMSGDGGREGRQQEISEISRGLKQLARELDIPILALSQLNRGVESRDNKRPMLSDLRESGCLSGDSIIIDAKSGRVYRIDELEKNRALLPFETKAMTSDLKIENFKITNAFFSGIKTIYRLTTKSGKTINATANHKFYKVDGWLRLDKLKVGDKIATPDRVDIKTSKNILVDNELILIAHLLGDGSILEGQPYHYTNEDMQNIEMVQYVAKELFDIDARIVQQQSWWHLYLTSPYHLTHNKKHPITLWYEKLHIQRVRSYEKQIPKAVFECSNKAIKLFLKHLWSTDGSITLQKQKNRTNKIAVYYASTSQILAKQVQSLLLRVGIISKLKMVKQIKKEKEYRPSYHVTVQGKNDLEKFLKEIGSFGKRGKKSEEYLKVLEETKANPNNGCFDKIVWQSYIKEAKDRQNISWRDFAKKLNMSYCGSTLFKSGVSKERMQRISEFLEDEKIDHFANADIYWDEIVSIEKGDSVKTYDLTVDSVHNFVANDIIVHNSIEQDADIVMFVYRDDVYREAMEKEKEMKAKAEGKEYTGEFKKKAEEDAEIIIGKQRNGPTGTVDLVFQKNFTRFVDASVSPAFEVVYEEGNTDMREGHIELPPIEMPPL